MVLQNNQKTYWVALILKLCISRTTFKVQHYATINLYNSSLNDALSFYFPLCQFEISSCYKFNRICLYAEVAKNIENRGKANFVVKSTYIINFDKYNAKNLNCTI